MEYMHYFGGGFIGDFGAFVWPLAALAFLWSVLWKGLALWKSARKGDTIWFVVFLFVNTLGILEIIYLYLVIKENPFARKASGETSQPPQTQ